MAIHQAFAWFPAVFTWYTDHCYFIDLANQPLKSLGGRWMWAMLFITFMAPVAFMWQTNSKRPSWVVYLGMCLYLNNIAIAQSFIAGYDAYAGTDLAVVRVSIIVVGWGVFLL